MSDVADVDAIVVVANDILGTEAIPDRTDLAGTIRLLQSADASNNDGVHSLNSVRGFANSAFLDPFEDIKFPRESVAAEDVGNQGSVPIGSELIGDKL